MTNTRRTIAARLAGTRKGVRRALAVAALAAMMVAGAAAPAHASWSYSNGLTPAGWTIAGSNGGGYFSSAGQWAHTPPWHAYLYRFGAGMSYVQRNVTVSETWRPLGCWATVYVQAVQNSAQVSIQIFQQGSINPFATAWANRHTYQGYQPLTVNFGIGFNQSPNLTVRVLIWYTSTYGGPVQDIRVDTLSMNCVEIPH